jgi:hypothetical protein
VLIRVIENDNLTLPPAVDLVFDTNTEPFARFGDDQPKVQPQHTIVWTAMCGHMLSAADYVREYLAALQCYADSFSRIH